MNCPGCKGYVEPPLDPPDREEDEVELTAEDIEIIKADEKYDDLKGK